MLSHIETTVIETLVTCVCVEATAFRWTSCVCYVNALVGVMF